jgi:uncharacterized protein (TIGR02996 family)
MLAHLISAWYDEAIREDARMSDADALLDAIFDRPDDDTPRLVYADWLQENGQENYAEFIRLQCAAARCEVWSAEANDLWVRIGRAWNRLSDEWWPATVEEWPLTESAFTPDPVLLDACHFFRGFLRRTVSVGLAQVLRYAACRAWLPAPGPRVYVSSADVPGLSASPLLRRITAIQVVAEWGGDESVLSTDFNPLLRSHHLTRLERLDLSHVLLQRSTVDVLLTAPHLKTIHEIEVGDHRRRDIDFEEVVLQLQGRFKRVIRP